MVRPLHKPVPLHGYLCLKCRSSISASIDSAAPSGRRWQHLAASSPLEASARPDRTVSFLRLIASDQHQISDRAVVRLIRHAMIRNSSDPAAADFISSPNRTGPQANLALPRKIPARAVHPVGQPSSVQLSPTDPSAGEDFDRYSRASRNISSGLDPRTWNKLDRWPKRRGLAHVVSGVHMASRRPDGLERLRQHRTELLLALRENSKSASTTQMTMAFNAMAGVFRRLGLPLGKALCNFGIGLAGRSHSQMTMKACLAEYLQQAYGLEMADVRTLHSSLLAFADSSHADGARFGAWQRRDALELLTGWRTAGVGDLSEIRQPCVASIFRFDRPDMVTSYVELLARLGAYEAVWRSWLGYRQWLKGQAEPWMVPEHQDGGEADRRGARVSTYAVLWTFQRALVRSGEPWRVREVRRVARECGLLEEKPVDGWVEASQDRLSLDESAQQALGEMASRIHDGGDGVQEFERLIGVKWVVGKSGEGYHTRRETVSSGQASS